MMKPLLCVVLFIAMPLPAFSMTYACPEEIEVDETVVVPTTGTYSSIYCDADGDLCYHPAANARLIASVGVVGKKQEFAHYGPFVVHNEYSRIPDIDDKPWAWNLQQDEQAYLGCKYQRHTKDDSHKPVKDWVARWLYIEMQNNPKSCTHDDTHHRMICD